MHISHIYTIDLQNINFQNWRSFPYNRCTLFTAARPLFFPLENPVKNESHCDRKKYSLVKYFQLQMRDLVLTQRTVRYTYNLAIMPAATILNAALVML